MPDDPNAKKKPPFGKPEEEPAVATEPPEEEEGEDLEGGGPITDPPPTPAPGGYDPGKCAAAIQALSKVLQKMGVHTHAGAGENLLTFVEHCVSALETKLESDGAAKPDQQKPDPMDSPWDEQEVAESPPLQMSAATMSTPTERETKLAAALLKQKVTGLRSRIATLHARGFIDDTIRDELNADLKAKCVQLSAADLDDNGEMRPTEVEMRVNAYERIAKTGKPGSFAPASSRAAPGDRNKPISTALSGADVEVVEPPYGDDQADSVAMQNKAGDELASRAMSAK